jgi:hypothetical protein
MNLKLLLIVLLAFATLPPITIAGEGKGAKFTEVLLIEDWPADALLDMGSMMCPGGAIEFVDPVTPVCTGSGRIHIRGVMGYGCYMGQSNGLPDARLSGVGMWVVNGNLDDDYTGPVWGTFMIVPSAGCDAQGLDDPAVYWKGTWRGKRAAECADRMCTWIGSLKLVGKGHGGAIDGLHLKADETIMTFTPMPAPWELIPGLGMTGPEGIATGHIKE